VDRSLVIDIALLLQPTPGAGSLLRMTQLRSSSPATRALSLDIDGVLHPVNVVDQIPTSFPVLPYAAELGLMRWVSHLVELLQGHDDVVLPVHSSWRRSVPEHEIRALLEPVAA